MKMWVVLDHDYDNTWIVAAYPSQALADEHVALMEGYVEEVEVRDSLHPDVRDPKKVAEREAEAAKSRREWEAYQKRSAADVAARAAVRPNPPHMGLCHCETFSSTLRFRNDHGYCSYCGGWAPNVFAENMGVVALHREIDKLAAHDRNRMREIVARTVSALIERHEPTPTANKTRV